MSVLVFSPTDGLFVHVSRVSKMLCIPAGRAVVHTALVQVKVRFIVTLLVAIGAVLKILFIDSFFILLLICSFIHSTVH